MRRFRFFLMVFLYDCFKASKSGDKSLLPSPWLTSESAFFIDFSRRHFVTVRSSSIPYCGRGRQTMEKFEVCQSPFSLFPFDLFARA